MIPVSTIFRREHIADINLATTNTSYDLPTQAGNLPMDRFMSGLELEFSGRMANPAADGPTGVLADGPYSLIERITVEGYHRGRKSQERFIDLRGADLRELTRIYSGLNPDSIPAALSVAASADNDIRFAVHLPFIPLRMPMRSKNGWLLDCPNYDALKLTIQYGDDNSVFSGQTTAPTFTAFGLATGNPRLAVDGIFAHAGVGRFQGFVPGRIWRWFREVTGSDIVTAATDVRLLNLPRGHRIRSVLLKTGVKSTAVSAGNNVYATLSDTILTNLELYRGINRIVRQYRSMHRLKNDSRMAYVIAPNDGYGLLDFAMNGWDGELMDARSLVAGPSGDVDFYLEADVAAAANQGLVAVYEEWRGMPIHSAAVARRR